MLDVLFERSLLQPNWCWRFFLKTAFASFVDSAEVSICCCSSAFGVEVICQNSERYSRPWTVLLHSLQQSLSILSSGRRWLFFGGKQLNRSLLSVCIDWAVVEKCSNMWVVGRSLFLCRSFSWLERYQSTAWALSELATCEQFPLRWCLFAVVVRLCRAAIETEWKCSLLSACLDWGFVMLVVHIERPHSNGA